MVTNSAVHGSIGWSFSAQYASNIYVEDSVFIGARAVGFNVISSKNVTINNILVGDVEPRKELTGFNIVDKESCIGICAYFEPDTSCEDVFLTNSIASGCFFVGILAPGHDCGEADNQVNFRNNIAHSVEGVGASIYPDPSK